MSNLPQTLAELRRSHQFAEERVRNRRVKDEMRDNLILRLRTGGPIFPGIVGYDDTVVPQIVNAVLSRHNFHPARAARAGEEPHPARADDAARPASPVPARLRNSRQSLRIRSAAAAASCWPAIPTMRRLRISRRNDRYVEKLATPDVTIADLIGDIDPIKAAKGGHELGSEYTVHYGLLPRANRGIFAINELPDLAGKIQVGLFNIMQEGDVQIKGYPVRLPLDVALVFSANPEDYTARGKIITPLKDRIGSEIRTHYPATLEEGIAITAQEAWTERNGHQLHVPEFVSQVIEQIAFVAREDKRIDKRSGVSQRLPISAMENVISNAERRAIRWGEKLVVPRVGDIYAAMPAMTGKLELEYEGELKGADNVVREIIRAAVARTYDKYFHGNSNMNQVVQWFDLGGEIQLRDSSSAHEMLTNLRGIQGLLDKLNALGLSGKDPSELVVSGAEFILEGLYAHKRIGRSEERTFTAGEKQPQREKPRLRDEDEERELRRQRRPFN